MVSQLLINKDSYQAMAKATNSYGDGKASKRIVQAILHKFELGKRRKSLVYKN